MISCCCCCCCCCRLRPAASGIAAQPLLSPLRGANDFGDTCCYLLGGEGIGLNNALYQCCMVISYKQTCLKKLDRGYV